MDQWQPYSNAPGAARRYSNDVQQNQSQQARGYNGHQAYAYEQYAGGMSSNPQSMHASPALPPQVRDDNGDVAMQDAGDAYSGIKYPMRPHHQQHLSAASRAVSQKSSHEQSSAAQRYSPMEALAPNTPYSPRDPEQNQNTYTSARQSPTRPSTYSSPNSYYTSRPQPQQLPPITPYSSNSSSLEAYPQSATAQLNALFGNDPKSPRRPAPQVSQGPPGRGPVPEFTKVRSVSDLQPKINAQPAFRRANPEGGFISVSLRFLFWKYGSTNSVFLYSRCKPSLLTFLQHTEYVTQASNMNHQGIRAEFSRSQVRGQRMTDLITRIVTTFFMSMISLDLRRRRTSTFIYTVAHTERA